MSAQLVMEFSKPLVVHCFVPKCKHRVTGFDADDNHDRMEAHYRALHAGLISSLVGGR